jgi:hypothetical protein
MPSARAGTGTRIHGWVADRGGRGASAVASARNRGGHSQLANQLSVRLSRTTCRPGEVVLCSVRDANRIHRLRKTLCPVSGSASGCITN